MSAEPGAVSLVQRSAVRVRVGLSLICAGALGVVFALRFLQSSGIQALWALGAGFGTSIAAVGLALATLKSLRLSVDLARREARVVASRQLVPLAKVVALRVVRRGERVQLSLRLEGGALINLSEADLARPSAQALTAQLAQALDTTLEEA